MSPFLIAAKMSGRLVSAVGVPGTKGGNFRSGRSTQSGTWHQPHQVHRAVDLVQIVAAEVELGQQKVRDFRRAQIRDFEPYRVAEVALAAVRPAAPAAGSSTSSSSTNRSLFAGDAETGSSLYSIAGETTRRRARGSPRKGIRTRNRSRRSHAGAGSPVAGPRGACNQGESGIAAERILADSCTGEIEALVEDARERMRRVQSDRVIIA